MKLKSLVLTLAAMATLNSQAAVQKDTTSYDTFRTQLQLKPGQTYLSMMINEVKPALDGFKNDIDEEAQNFPKQYRKWQTDLISQGAGVAIRIDSKNYFFNVGYGDGSNVNDDLKSGRSYGVGPTHRQSDPSDIAYLTELEEYLKSEPQNAAAFYEALFKVLLNCDSSGWSQLSNKGQIVATDFLAIYTAELDRHLMVDLAPTSHPWEIDLAAATLDSAFVATVGKMVKQGEMQDGSVKEFWAPGKVGSGIGETRRDRKILQKLIADYESKSHTGAAAINKISNVIGQVDQDVVQSLLEYLNSPAQAKVTRINGNDLDQLTHGILDYIGSTTTEANQIVDAQE